jgi:hypothetical protein
MIHAVFTDRAQWLICSGCNSAWGPKPGTPLLPTLFFMVLGKEFVRRHRFCLTASIWPPAERAALGSTHSFPPRDRAPWEPEREPGEEG